MISPTDLYHVFSAVVPLYVAMLIAYASVKWWKIFTPEQCSGINRFVSLFAVPLLSFDFISSNNPYSMNFRLITADSLQKVIALIALFIFPSFLTPRRSLDWPITLFSLSTIPNTLLMGLPLLKGMYGGSSSPLMVQIIALQALVWVPVMLILFEYRAAMILIYEQFPETQKSIESVEMGSDVSSVGLSEPLDSETELGEDGKLHVKLRKSASFSSASLYRVYRISNAEIYSPSSLENQGSKNSFVNGKGLDEGDGVGKDLHLFARSSSTSCLTLFQGEAQLKDYGKDDLDSGKRPYVNKAHGQDPTSPNLGSSPIPSNASTQTETREGPPLSKMGSSSTTKPIFEGESKPPSGLTKLILTMVCRKLIRNPNTYAGLIGLAWSLISFKFHIKMPQVVADSIGILARTGLGMSMLSLGLFMASLPRIIACGKKVAALTMVVRFIVGPAVMAATSVAVGLRGDLLRLGIVQAALPQAVVTFVFAKEYNLHPDVLSTGVIFGMLVSLPFTLVYYILLGL